MGHRLFFICFLSLIALHETSGRCSSGPCPVRRHPIKAPVPPTKAPVRRTTQPIQPTKSPIAPTTKPIAPTVAPINPTPAPVGNFPPFPSGPYILASASSVLVKLPDPPSPNLSTSRSNCPHLQSGLLDWYSPSTWGGSVPQSGQHVTIPANSKVVVSSSVVEQLGYITVPQTSELILGENSNGITIDAKGFNVQGALRAGSESCRIETSVTITLHGTRPADAVTNPKPVTYKGIAVTGTLSLHGKRFFRTWTRLAKTVNVGDTALMLQHAVNWKAGQQLVLVTTAMKDSKEWHQNEVLVVKAVHPSPPANVGAIVYLTTATQYKHIANNGYQAEVGLLSRAIVIQGAANDSEPTDPDPLNCQGSRWIYGNYAQPCGNTALTGFGAHVVILPGGKGYVEGIELFRVGQTNVLGKYPMHFHLLGECPDCYFRDSSIHRSYYRCISVHGTNSSLVSENVAYDITGYCYYLEDGVESNNTISFNLAALINNIGPENPWGYGQQTSKYAQSPTLTNPADVTAAGFYITNVHNNIIGNAASGGWAGFAFPVLQTALQSFRSLVFRPSDVTSLTIDGNTAHSTGWWWYHAGAFYSGGALYYNSNNVLEYNPGRTFDNPNRATCTVNACQRGDCDYGCPEQLKDAVRFTNTKTFLVASVGVNSWSGRFEVSGYEAHDVALTMESLSDGFWLDKALTVCRTGETLAMPVGSKATYVNGNGFFWYDTWESHIITNAKFQNCGYRSNQYNQYDNSPTRGCGDSDSNGCSSDSTTFGFLSHSDQYNPQIMQGTRAITFSNCGRRFKMTVYTPETVSGRNQNWLDADGSVTGLNEPSLIGSGFAGVTAWWKVDDEVVYDPQGPLHFIKQNNGPQRGIGHFHMSWDQSVNSQVGTSVCLNGDYSKPCPILGYIRHRGHRFSPEISNAGPGMPVTATGDITGPVGGFGWMMNIYAGAPTSIRFEQVVARPDTPMLLSIPYPQGTSFTIIAYAADWCGTDNGAYSCNVQFTAVSSIDQVRNGAGNTYYVDANGVLSVRLVDTAIDFVGRPSWFLPTFSDTGRYGVGYAFDRFERSGVVLPRTTYGPYLTLEADCSSSDGVYCTDAPPAYDPDVCPAGYVQTAYDACCTADNSRCLYADGSTS